MKRRIFFLFLTMVIALSAHGQENSGILETVRVRGYTEPYRDIGMTASEPGLISEIRVEEGQLVKEGDALILLDNKVREAELKIAKTQAESTAQIEVAVTEMELANERFKQIEALKIRGSATRDELNRASATLQSARNKHTLAVEAQTIAKLQVGLIEAQIERRIVRSSINGIVLEINRDVAESTTGMENKPMILARVAQLDRLRLVVYLPAGSARKLQKGDLLPVRILLSDSLESAREESGDDTTGMIEFISPAIDPSSKTVKARLVIDNEAGKYRSGSHAIVFAPVTNSPAEK